MNQANHQLWMTLHGQFLRYRSGDETAARQVFKSLLDILRRYFRLRTSSLQDSEDLAQASLLKVHFARASFAEDRSFKTWVYTVASRCLIDHWRGSKGKGVLGGEEDAATDALQLPDTTLTFDLRLEYGEALEKALATLKPIDRAIVYLYGVEGLSMAEVAQLHGLTAQVVKVRAHRSYVKLREILGETR